MRSTPKSNFERMLTSVAGIFLTTTENIDHECDEMVDVFRNCHNDIVQAHENREANDVFADIWDITVDVMETAEAIGEFK